jgi:S1-C subfamily serine protease
LTGTVVAALLLVSCSADEHRSDADVALASAVRVEAEGCSDRPFVGGGSFIASDRVVTVAHVVAGSSEVDVVLPDGSEHEATVVAIDRSKDLAVLAVRADVAPLRSGSMRHGTRGSFGVWRVDRFVPQSFVAAEGRVIDTDDIDHIGSGDRRGYIVEAHIDPGDSGSVLVAGGVAVAVVFARSTTDPGRAYATDIAEAEALIDGAGDTAVDVGACTRP